MIRPIWTVLVLSCEPPFVWPHTMPWAQAEELAARLIRLGFGNCLAVPVGRIEESLARAVA